MASWPRSRACPSGSRSAPVSREAGTGHRGAPPPVHGGATDTGAGSTQPVPGPIDPMATPGIGGIESQGIPNIAGAPGSVNGGRSPRDDAGAPAATTDRPP